MRDVFVQGCYGWDEEERERALRSQITYATTRLTYYEVQQRKYERAARYPWIPVAPDPPEPE